jgi:probable rRNA maturation factor
MMRMKSPTVTANKSVAERSAGRKTPAITIAVKVEDWRWRRNPATLRLIRRAARLALKSVGIKKGALTLLLADDAALKTLNRRFRGKSRTTNVLSFPSPAQDYVGDIAIAYGIVAREAGAQGKRIKVHAAHLAVHGVLHLAGHDHENEAEALAMEALEVQILERLGIPNPYSGKPYRTKGKAA